MVSTWVSFFVDEFQVRKTNKVLIVYSAYYLEDDQPLSTSRRTLN